MGLSAKQWIGVVAVAIGVAIGTWSALNLGREIYKDWSFLHAVRLLNEQQIRQGPASTPPVQGK